MNEQSFDVLIIGAGAAGLMAAMELALTGRSVALIEAKERCGGRINTIYTKDGEPVELGAEFVHGDLPITLQLFEKAGIKKTNAGGQVWQHKNGQLSGQEDFIEDYDDLEKKFKELKQDMPVADFIQQHLGGERYKDARFTLENYVEGYYAADPSKASTTALYKELSTGDEKNYRVEGGYQPLISYLENQCTSNGVRVFPGEEVREVKWAPSHVQISTTIKTIKGKKIVVTVPLGVLQSGAIQFSPALPDKITAAKHLGFGLVAKVVLHFTKPFWKDKQFTGNKDLSKLGFLFSEEPVPTWWSHYPQDTTFLTGWLAGPSAARYKGLSKKEITQQAISSLANIFGVNEAVTQEKVVHSYWYNWLADSHFCGAYSYSVVNGEHWINIIKEPVEATVYFAGEALVEGNEIGTVEAALMSGRETAHRLIADSRP